MPSHKTVKSGWMMKLWTIEYDQATPMNQEQHKYSS